MLQVGIRPDSIMSNGSQQPHAPPDSLPYPTPPQIPHNSYISDSRQPVSSPAPGNIARTQPARSVQQQPPSTSMAQPSQQPRLSSTAPSSNTPYSDPAISRSTPSLPSYLSGETLRSTSSVPSSSGNSPQPQPIKIRDLAHLVELAREDSLQAAAGRGQRAFDDPTRRYEISAMPVADVIEMVAGLLTRITTTNDRQQGHLQRNMPPADSTNLTPIGSSVLAFHGRNVPTISINNYLGRIHRYCPTTYEVFLSLLVYFDRMTERVNATIAMQSTTSRPSTANGSSGLSSPTLMGSAPTSPLSYQVGPPPLAPPGAPSNALAPDPFPQFVVDSFNIHRLVIAGVTCASKFFSDVFFTNSRYAKVGGLPLRELNHLELQFLILNDFRLSVPVEELESYGTMLVQFYAREALQNIQAGISAPAGQPQPPTPGNPGNQQQQPPQQGPPAHNSVATMA